MLTKLATLLLVMQGFNPDTQEIRHHYVDRAVFASSTIEVALKAEKSTLSPELVGAVMVGESSLRIGSLGKHGEVGLMQIKPDGMGALLCKDLNLYKPVDNVRCGIRLLERGEEACPLTGYVKWVGQYRGHRGCKETDYGKRVVARMLKAEQYAVTVASAGTKEMD